MGSLIRKRGGKKMSKTIGIVGTLDTKGAEFKFLQEQIEASGLSTLVVNAGVLGEPLFEPDVPAIEVAKAGGDDLEDMRRVADRGRNVAAMAKGVAVIVQQLYDEGKIHGVISLGGSAGTTIGTSAMRALPVGVPKVMVSTMASGDTSPYVDTKDIAMIYSVVDIAGINSLSRQILSNAAGAIAGMAQIEAPVGEDKPLIGITMFGVTTPCVMAAQAILENAGYECLIFHATGAGGRAMEDLIRGGFIVGVLDVTTTELADELVGGVLSAGPNRLDAAGEAGIPQVIAPGALDMVNFGPPETVPDQFKGRKFYHHNPTVTLMRTTKDENAELGRIMAEKLSKAKGPTTVLIPKQGVSAIDQEGQPFYDAEADAAFIENLKANLGENVNLMEMDNNINDDDFASKLANVLLGSLNK